MTQKSSFRAMLAALVALTLMASSLSAQDDKKNARRGGKRGPAQPAGVFSAEAVRAVPGLRALVRLSDEQKAKLAEARKAALGSEEYQNALKTSKDKNADKKAKREAMKVVRETQAGLRSKAADALSDDQKKLVASVNEAAGSAAKKVRQEHAAKLKELKSDKEARRKLQKEVGEKVRAAVTASVTGVLSDEQKAVVAKASKRGGKKGAERGKKEQGPEAKKGKGKGKKKEGKKGKKKDAEGAV